MTEDTEQKTYTTREFANIFGFYAQDVQQACKAGEVKATKDEKGRWRIPESEVKRFHKKN